MDNALVRQMLPDGNAMFVKMASKIILIAQVCILKTKLGFYFHGYGEAKIGLNGMCAGKKLCQLLVHVISYPKWYGIKIFI